MSRGSYGWSARSGARSVEVWLLDDARDPRLAPGRLERGLAGLHFGSFREGVRWGGCFGDLAGCRGHGSCQGAWGRPAGKRDLRCMFGLVARQGGGEGKSRRRRSARRARSVVWGATGSRHAMVREFYGPGWEVRAAESTFRMRRYLDVWGCLLERRASRLWRSRRASRGRAYSRRDASDPTRIAEQGACRQ